MKDFRTNENVKNYYKKEDQRHPRHQSEFYGYCYCCSMFGHKAARCRNYMKFYNCHNYGHIARRCTTRPHIPIYTKVWRRKTEVQNKNDDEYPILKLMKRIGEERLKNKDTNDDEDPTLEVDEVSEEEKHHSNEILVVKEDKNHGRSSCSKPIIEMIN